MYYKLQLISIKNRQKQNRYGTKATKTADRDRWRRRLVRGRGTNGTKTFVQCIYKIHILYSC